MKVFELVEGSLESIGVLNDLVKVIMKQWPDEIPEDSEYVIGIDPEARLRPEQGNTQPIQGIDPLIKKYEEYPKIVKGLEHLKDSWIVIDNTEAGMHRGALGVYNWGHITIYLSAIKKNHERWEIDYFHYRDVSTVKKVLAHELRHLFQDKDYPTYMRSKQAFAKDWNQRSMEWDAEWTAIVSENNPKDWNNAADFAEDMIWEWLKEMHVRGSQEVPPKVVEKYRKKTIKYYFAHNRDSLKKLLKMVIDDNSYFKSGSKFVQRAIRDFHDITDWSLTPAQYVAARNIIINHWKNNAATKQPGINTI
jgi:hypothetical protein